MSKLSAIEIKTKLEEEFGKEYPHQIRLTDDGFPLVLTFLDAAGNPLDPEIAIAGRFKRLDQLDDFINTRKADYDRWSDKLKASNKEPLVQQDHFRG